MKKVIVFGSTGMLGRYVCKYLESSGFEIVSVDRKAYNIYIEYDYLFEWLFTFKDVYAVVNCAGIIKSRKDVSDEEMIVVNSLFPRKLSDYCEKNNIKLIHITTDCVFDGLDKFGYIESSSHTARDLYGKSKSLGEPENCCVIRTSIIGEEINQSRSLIEWAKSQKNKEVNGYTNHWWNGVTCLQLAKITSDILKDKIPSWCGVRHIISPDTVTKNQLLEIISEVYELGLIIKPYRTDYPCYRALSTAYKPLSLPSIKEQLVEMKNWTKKEFC